MAARPSAYNTLLKMVILDWAGTTLDHGCMAPAEAFREAFAHAGLPITMQEARAPMGVHKKVHIQRITEDQGVRARWRETFGRDPNKQDVEALFARFVPEQMEILPRYATLIPGTVSVVKNLQSAGIKIGSTTGYTSGMMKLLQLHAADQGYKPDATVCADEVQEGRPAPWMCLENARRLGVYPMSSIVKVGDTVGDIAEGRNAGMWTVGITETGNEVGLTKANLDALPDADRGLRIRFAEKRLQDAGAHMLILSIAQLPRALDEISTRIERGRRP